MTGYPEPVDPWAGHTRETPVIFRDGGRRPLYGFVYELRVRGQRPDECPYVGKCEGSTPTAVADRVHGTSASAHTSRQSIARDPWKAGILPGRDGWRILERVYATGDPAEDDARLRRAEADWIDRKNATRNRVRPVRPFGAQPPRRPPAARPSTVRPRPRVQEIREMQRRRRARLVLMWLAVLAAVFTFFVFRVVNSMDLPWPAAPWIASPVVGFAAAWLLLSRLRKGWNRLVR